MTGGLERSDWIPLEAFLLTIPCDLRAGKPRSLVWVSSGCISMCVCWGVCPVLANLLQSSKLSYQLLVTEEPPTPNPPPLQPELMVAESESPRRRSLWLFRGPRAGSGLLSQQGRGFLGPSILEHPPHHTHQH